MTKREATVSSYGQMEDATVESGKAASSMEKEPILLLQGLKDLVNGKTVSVSVGLECQTLIVKKITNNEI